MVIFLESSNVILSPISLSLVEQGNYFQWINDQASDLFTQHAIMPHTTESLYTYVENKQKERNSIWLGIIHKEDNKHVGNIDISDIDWINRVGTYNILIGDKNYHGKGIGYEASHLILNHVFNRLNLNRIQLGVDERNKGAIRLYQKLGFREEGRFEKGILASGEYFDIIRMRILQKEYMVDKKYV